MFRFPSTTSASPLVPWTSYDAGIEMRDYLGFASSYLCADVCSDFVQTVRRILVLLTYLKALLLAARD